MFIPTAEIVILTGTKTNEANAEIETQPATVEDRKSNYLITYMSFDIFHLKDNFLLHQFF